MSTFLEKVLEKVINNIWQLVIVVIILYFVINNQILNKRIYDIQVQELVDENKEIQKERDNLMNKANRLENEKKQIQHERDSLQIKLDSVVYIVDNIPDHAVHDSITAWLNNH